MWLKRFVVHSNLPDALKPLRTLANNFWWSWTPDATELFASLDPELWEQVYHNPMRLLQRISQSRLQKLAQNKPFLKQMNTVHAQFEQYLAEGKEAREALTELKGPIVYFSAEFGLHESLPVYSGGLGILAGDHCKAASDLGLPLIGMGILYKSGYFVQRLTPQGVQEAIYPEHNFDELPINTVQQDDGKDLVISLDIAGRNVDVRIWKVNVGSVPIYLLDTDLPQNDKDARQITSRLYGGGTETRVAQEMLLGIGGVRALDALGIQPSVYHINEGHAAFLSLERARQLQTQSLSFDEAICATAANQVFTTHTPVPAGHDRFGRELFERFLGSYINTFQVPFEEIWKLGVAQADDPQEPFCMTILALRTARLSNGVSQLHGHVSRTMWRHLWHEIPTDEVPISHITNGIHTPTWLAAPMRKLFDEHLGEDWEERLLQSELWQNMCEQIPDEALWNTKQQLKQTLVDFTRQRTLAQRLRFEEDLEGIEEAKNILDPNALTIGFARRFAPYKRATLIFRDLQRLKRIVNQPGRPVQILFAGKSHPHNQEGKDLLRDVYLHSRHPDFAGKVVFIEDYDTNVGRHLVQGVDVWLNNPLRPQEASGTSGQKVPLNGGVNLSILDGWWVEGYHGDNGWRIGDNREYNDRESQDKVDAESLYSLLEDHIVPLYYDREEPNSPPTGWLQCMRASMRSVIPHFNTKRMVLDYLRQMYIPAAKAGSTLHADAFAQSRSLTQWRQHIKQHWPQVKVQQFTHLRSPTLTVSSQTPIQATVHLGALKPDDVQVQLYVGRFDEHAEAHIAHVTSMTCGDEREPGLYQYTATLEPEETGDYGYNIRIIPKHSLLSSHETGLIRWG